MKDIRRKSLDELVVSMPLLDEEEMSCCIGGVSFYDYSGNMLGEVGNDGAIRIISLSEYNDLKKDNDFSGCASWGKTVQESKMNTNAVKNILSAITGYDSGYFSVVSGIMGNSEAATLYNPNGYLIQFDTAGFSLRNENTIRSTMMHEEIHIRQGNQPMTQWEAENSAYMQQTDNNRKMQ